MVLPADDAYELQLLTASGQVIMAQSWFAIPGNRTAVMDRKALPSGIYLLKVHHKTTGIVRSIKVQVK